MRDFRIVSARILLKVHSVAPIRNFFPPSVIVLGDDLDLTSEVLYNGVTVLEFFKSSSSRLVVRIPDSQVGKSFDSIQVFSSVAIAKRDAVLSLAVRHPVESIQGLDRMIQCWVMIFMTTPGSDVFTPKSGGGGQAIIGRNTDRTGKGVAADLTLAIDRTKTELAQLQAKRGNLPLSEKILSCTLDSTQFDQVTATLSAQVTLKNMLGNQAEVAVR